MKVATVARSPSKAASKSAAAKTAASKKSANKKAVKAAFKAAVRKSASKKAAAKKAAGRKAATKVVAKPEPVKVEVKPDPKAGKQPRLRSQPVEVQEIDVQIQRERRSRLIPYKPRSYGARPKQAKAGVLLETLTKNMGKALPLPSRAALPTVVEMGIFCIFATGGNSARVSFDAMVRLRKSFSEWNEFRVSEAYEFLEVLEDINVIEPYDHCEKVLEFVNEIYQDQNAVDLEFLRDLDAVDRLIALNRYRSLGPALSHYMALGLQGFDGILFHYSWSRVVQRVGIVPRAGSPKALVASLAEVFGALDTLALQINLIDLGEEICLPKNPQCRNCYLVLSCKSRKL
ncbi:MAG: hypothetical protein CMJ85_14750 [Planctomycetes bacterium]|nr:hypothetical protein [Planctomycetota bacterium]